MLRLVRASTVVTLLLGAIGVSQAPSAAPTRALTESVVLLERAASALTAPSADYRAVLRDLVSAWPSGGPAFVPSDLTTFLTRAPTGGVDFACSADFVRDHARREILRLKDTLLEANPQPA